MKSVCIFLALFLFFLSGTAPANDPVLQKKVLSLLDAYCPDGSKIVHMSIEKLTHIQRDNFMSYIPTGADEATIVKSLNTVVHEECHSLTLRGSKILEERFGRESNEFYRVDFIYLSGDRSILVYKTKTFPSREMVSAFPDSLRTYRFTYVDNKEEVQSTQQSGIYGLLDEFNAYYKGTLASFDLLGYYQKLGKTANWHDFFQGVNGTLYGCLEFKFFFLKYLQFAEKKYPDIYDALMQNKNLITAFLDIDRGARELANDYFYTKDILYDQLRGYGWNVTEEENGNMLMIEKNGRKEGHMTFMNVYALLENEMQRPDYQNLMGQMNTIVEG